MFRYILIAILSYLLCSVSFAILLSSHLSGGDVRAHGSGNAGATNMARVYGLGKGILTLAGDMFKCALAMGLSKYFAGEMGMAVSGVACLIGHCFPVFYKFKGGKGVAVGAALALMVDWRIFLILVAMFFAVALLSKKVSLASCSVAAGLVVMAFAFQCSTPIRIMCALSAALVIFQHRANLKRILDGTEPDFKPAGKKE